MQRLLQRMAVLAAVIAAIVAGSGFVGTAKAINPTQTTVTGVVNAEFWDLEAFWKPILAYYGVTYVRPGFRYYNYYDAYGRIVDFNSPCGSTADSHGTQGFYCPDNGVIHLDYEQQRGNLLKFGDGSVGFWLAHEFGHHIELVSGVIPDGPNLELLADCYAGMYVRYGIYRSFRLAWNDYLEARSQLSTAPLTSPTHGSRQQRLASFDLGYSQFSVSACV